MNIGTIIALLRLRDELSPALAVAGRNMEQAGRKMQDAGRALLPLSAAVAGVGAASLKMSVDFSDALLKMETLVGISREQVQAWRGDILALSGETARAPVELADAMFFVTSAGLRGQVALDALRASAQAAALGLGDTATIADAVTSAMNAYGQANLSAERATNILALAVRAGKLEASALAPVMGRLLPTASSLGIAFEDVAGSLAVMSRTGLNAAEASTSLNAIMSLLAKGGGKEAQEIMGAVGLSMGRLRDMAAKPGGLIEAMRLLAERTKNLDEEALAKVIPNIRAFRGVMNVLAQDASVVDDVMGQVASGVDVLGKGMKRLAEEPGFKFRQFLALAKVRLIELGDVLVPTFIAVVDIGGDLLEFAGRAIALFAGLPGPVRGAGIALAGIVAVAGPVLLVLGAMVASAGAIATAFGAGGIFAGALGAAAGAIGSVLTVLTGPLGLIALLTGLLLSIKPVREAVFDLGTKAFAAVKDGISKVLDVAGEVLNFLRDVGSVIADKVVGRIQDFVGSLTAVWNWWNDLLGLGPRISSWFNTILSGAQAASGAQGVFWKWLKDLTAQGTTWGDSALRMADMVGKATESTLGAAAAAREQATAVRDANAQLDAMSAAGEEVGFRFKSVDGVMTKYSIGLMNARLITRDLADDLDPDLSGSAGTAAGAVKALDVAGKDLTDTIRNSRTAFFGYGDSVMGGITEPFAEATTTVIAGLAPIDKWGKILGASAPMMSAAGLSADEYAQAMKRLGLELEDTTKEGNGFLDQLRMAIGSLDGFLDTFEGVFGIRLPKAVRGFADAAELALKGDLQGALGVAATAVGSFSKIGQAALNGFASFLKGDFVGAILSGVSAVVGIFKGLFGKSTAKSVMKGFGIDLGDALLDEIQKLGESRFGRDFQAAFRFLLDKAIDAGVESIGELRRFAAEFRNILADVERGTFSAAEGIDTMMRAIGPLLDEVDRFGDATAFVQVAETIQAVLDGVRLGAFSAAEANDLLDASFERLVESSKQFGDAGAEAIRNIVLQSREAAGAFQAIEDFIVDKTQTIVDALDSVLARIEKRLQKVADSILVTPEIDSDQLTIGARAMNEMRFAADALGIQLSELVAQGVSWDRILETVGETTQRLVAAMDAAGVRVPDSLREIADLMDLISTRKIKGMLDGLGAMTTVFEQIREQGLVPTAAMFDAFAGNVKRTLKDFRDAGASAEQVFIALGPALSALLGAGVKLPKQIRTILEQDFGIDLSDLVPQSDLLQDQIKIQDRMLDNLILIRGFTRDTSRAIDRIGGFQTSTGDFKIVPGVPTEPRLIVAHGGEFVGRPATSTSARDDSGIMAEIRALSAQLAARDRQLPTSLERAIRHGFQTSGRVR